jgi:acetylornithine deacetylase/succinyl-diaminopimelate desuccinylase-like protein
MRTHQTVAGALALTAALLSAPAALAQKAQPGEADFRSLYKQLVEINTTASTGSCTAAAEVMKTRLSAAGYPESDLHLIVPPDNPREGNLIAVLHGSDAKLPAILLLAHIDVVEAKREDWVRDPFKLTEEDGYFYARGASDDKAQAAIFADQMIRFRKEGYKPKRTVKMALTCGEEGGFPLNGVSYILEHNRDLIEAGFALNEGAGGSIDHATGKYVFHGIQAGEKIYQDFELEVTNPGGHSSRPVPDNAIYRLAAALRKVEAYRFPVEVNSATAGFLTRMADLESDKSKAADMRAFAKNPVQSDVSDRLSKDTTLNATIRTTCVATQLSGGHAPNALPQRATANINCRIFPGHGAAEIQKQLETVINDPDVKFTMQGLSGPPFPPPPLTPEILGPIEKISQQMFPGLPVIPQMATGATDGSFLNAAGIPTYGVSGMFEDDEVTHAHGLNEAIPVKSLLEGREFLYRLTKAYAGGK